MKLADLKGKKICILGFGREGRAVLKALEGEDITIADIKEISVDGYKTQTGDDYLKDLNKFDVIIRSPGVFPSPELEAVKDKITNSTQIFLDSVSGSTVIGITGSKGKSTTVSFDLRNP